MLEIEKPIISVKEISDDGSYGVLCLEPLERGLGNTLGNALRRTLISQLPGMAITTIQIEGLQHEFATIEGVKEDTTDLVLAFKSVRMKNLTRELKVLRIEKEGPCEVKAGDIICDSDVEILNKDLHIATLEKGAVLNVELRAEVSRGFVVSDENKREDMNIGEIPIDSLFSPITKVNYTVSDKRIGKKVNHDSLELEITTDGSITVKEALKGSAGLLIEYLNMFFELSESEAASIPVVEREEKEINKTLNTLIEDLELTQRPKNCLRRAGIKTLGDLVSHTEDEVMSVKNLGKKSFEEIRDKIHEKGLFFKEVENYDD